MGGQFIDFEIGCYVNEHLVDGIGVYVLRHNVAKVDFINTYTIFNVMRHAWLGDEIVNGKFLVNVKFYFRIRFA